MKNENPASDNVTLVLGRAGELVDYSDPETFELVDAIFAWGGPYRKVLEEFGIGNPEFVDSFLVYKEGRIYSDIQKENSALWESCLRKLVHEKGKTCLVKDLSLKSLAKGFSGFIKKNVIEAKIIANPKHYLAIADERYESFSDFVYRVVQEKELNSKEFLEHYANVVYVTYLYELFFNYNLSTLDTEALAVKPCVKGYIDRNDYLVKFDTDYAEIKFAPLDGFSLKKTQEYALLLNTPMEQFKFIPSDIPYCECALPLRYLVEKKLQCLKNNLRLKSAFLLNFIKL
jgi:hypothetical protein